MSDYRGSQQWAPPGYAPPYGAPQMAPQQWASPTPAPGGLPPLWVLGANANEQASGPYRAPPPSGAPAPNHKVSPEKARTILLQSLGRIDVPVRLSLKRRFQVSYIIIGIPLWFNIIHDYLLFTDRHIVFSRATLWAGVDASETFAIPYERVSHIYLKKGSWRALPQFGVVQSNGAGDVEVSIDKKPAGLLAWFFSAPFA